MLVSPHGSVLPTIADVGKTSLSSRHKHSMRTDQARPVSRCGGGLPLDVRSWRRCRLLEAGFPLDAAESLAADPGFDLHALLELVDRGCPPLLAVRIMAPLSGQAAR